MDHFNLELTSKMKNCGQTIKTQIKCHFEETQRTPIWTITLKSLGHVKLPPGVNELTLHYFQRRI